MRSKYELVAGVREAFNYFHENNDKIVIITARNNKYYHGSIKDTLAFLSQNNLKYDKIYFKQSKKGKKAYKENIDLFIDDKEQVLDNVSKYGIKCLCMNQSSKYPSFQNWYEILEYLKKEV